MIEKLKGELVLPPGFHDRADYFTVYQEVMEDACERGFFVCLMHRCCPCFGWEWMVLYGFPNEIQCYEPDHLGGVGLSELAFYLEGEDGGLYFIGPFDDDAEAIDGGEA